LQWTENRSPEKSRIAVFEHIRDIPYAIIPELRGPQRGPSGILELNKGSCQPKHYLLAILFAKLGLEIKYVTYPFYWGRQPIKYPPELKALLKELPPAYHLTLKARINGKWVLVDATFDLVLKKAGFPVNLTWDGSSDSLNAVLPLEEIIHESIAERVSFEAQQKSLYSQQQIKAYAEFVDKLNAWLLRLRA